MLKSHFFNKESQQTPTVENVLARLQLDLSDADRKSYLNDLLQSDSNLILLSIVEPTWKLYLANLELEIEKGKTSLTNIGFLCKTAWKDKPEYLAVYERVVHFLTLSNKNLSSADYNQLSTDPNGNLFFLRVN